MLSTILIINILNLILICINIFINLRTDKDSKSIEDINNSEDWIPMSIKEFKERIYELANEGKVFESSEIITEEDEYMFEKNKLGR